MTNDLDRLKRVHWCAFGAEAVRREGGQEADAHAGPSGPRLLSPISGV